jgi:L-lactate dehydrogenase complex protein LldG
MNSRDAILGRIRTALADDPDLERPPVAGIWPRQNPNSEEMAARFAEELRAVGGELHRCDSMAKACQKLADLVREGDWTVIGSVDRPLCRQLATSLEPENVVWAGPDDTPQSMAKFEVGLIQADMLLADTGTCMVANATQQERIMTYLPPVCFVVAQTDQLVEHMPSAWDRIAPRVVDPDLRGEFVFITGPSRTADIEKILILGVHGPKRLIVILVG